MPGDDSTVGTAIKLPPPRICLMSPPGVALQSPGSPWGWPGAAAPILRMRTLRLSCCEHSGSDDDAPEAQAASERQHRAGGPDVHRSVPSNPGFISLSKLGLGCPLPKSPAGVGHGRAGGEGWV